MLIAVGVGEDVEDALLDLRQDPLVFFIPLIYCHRHLHFLPVHGVVARLGCIVFDFVASALVAGLGDRSLTGLRYHWLMTVLLTNYGWSRGGVWIYALPLLLSAGTLVPGGGRGRGRGKGRVRVAWSFLLPSIAHVATGVTTLAVRGRSEPHVGACLTVVAASASAVAAAAAVLVAPGRYGGGPGPCATAATIV